MELIRFIFSSPWILLGVVVIIICIGGIISNVVRIVCMKRVADNAVRRYLQEERIRKLMKELKEAREENADEI